MTKYFFLYVQDGENSIGNKGIKIYKKTPKNIILLLITTLHKRGEKIRLLI